MNNFNLSTLSIDELKSLRNRITSELNYRNHQTLVENKKSIQINDYVTVDHPKTQGKILGRKLKRLKHLIVKRS